MKYCYKTSGTCARQIEFEVDENNNVHNVKFYGGCNGNLQAVSKLVENKNLEEVVLLLKGINCGGKGTSCPDQLAKACLECLSNAKN